MLVVGTSFALDACGVGPNPNQSWIVSDQESSCPKVEFSRIITSEVNSAETALHLMEQMQQAKEGPAASVECNLQTLGAIM